MSSSPDGEGYITKQAFVNMSGSIPNSVLTSDSSLNSETPTQNRSLECVNTANSSKTNINRNSVISNKAYTKEFDINDKHMSLTLSYHSSDDSTESISNIIKSRNKEINENNEVNENKEINKDNKVNENKEINKDNKVNDENKDEKGSKSDVKGSKKHGLKYLKNTISKTFSKASFRIFSISHKKTNANSNQGNINDKDFNFESKEEQEEFDTFVNNLNTKKVSNKHRPSLNGVFNNQDLNSQDSKPPSNDGLPPLQPRRKSIKDSKYELALKHLRETLKDEDPVVLEKYLKEANNDEDLALKNYLKDSEDNKNTCKRYEPENKEASLELNEMNNIEKNKIWQDPIIIDDKKERWIK